MCANKSLCASFRHLISAQQLFAMSMLLALPASPTQLDEETASLIAQLALADLDEMAGDFADQQLAFELQAEALETMLRNFGIDPVRAARQARQQLTQSREGDRCVLWSFGTTPS